jgi:hypothetical protein
MASALAGALGLVESDERAGVKAFSMRAQMLQATRPVDVVHIRQQLLKWWSTPGQWQQRFAMQGRRQIQGYEENTMEPVATQMWMRDAIKDSTLYWVSPEMCELVSKMSPSIPDCLPHPPSECGFVVFANSLPGTDATTGGEIFTSALMWAPVQTLAGWCIALETYAWRDLVFLYQLMTEKDQEAFRQAVPCRLMPTGGSEWPVDNVSTDFSKLTADDEIMEKSMLEDRQIASTFWTLCQEKITLNEPWVPDRPTRRMAQRQRWHSIPEVRVIRLREPQRPSKGEGGTVDWSHRWLVSEHWRRQWYASEGTHKPKLIHAYQKGPADKPLIVRETVRALVR